MRRAEINLFVLLLQTEKDAKDLTRKERTLFIIFRLKNDFQRLLKQKKKNNNQISDSSFTCSISFLPFKQLGVLITINYGKMCFS